MFEGKRIYDAGSGKHPFLKVEDKGRLKTHIIGLGIAREELNSAPKGARDETIDTSTENAVGNNDRDLVICSDLMENVPDTKKALAGISSLLKPYGTALIFVPSRNAIFARLNTIIRGYFLA